MNTGTKQFFTFIGITSTVLAICAGLYYGVGAYNDSLREDGYTLAKEEMGAKVRKADAVLAHQARVELNVKTKLAEAEKAHKAADAATKLAETTVANHAVEHKAFVKATLTLSSLLTDPASLNYRKYDKTCEVRYGWISSQELKISKSSITVGGTEFAFVRNGSGDVVDLTPTQTKTGHSPQKFANY